MPIKNTFWKLNLDDWNRTLKPTRSKSKTSEDIDTRTEYALGRLKKDKLVQFKEKERKYDLNKIYRHALHEPTKKVKYVLNPLENPDKFTKEWKQKYEEKFVKKRYVKKASKGSS